MKLPLEWVGDPKLAYFALERKVSPGLEEFVRTDAFLDAMTAATSIQRLVGHAVRGAQAAIAGSLGFPTGRQVERLTRAVEQLGEQLSLPPAERVVTSHVVREMEDRS
ncbi:hypothetical protein HH308_15650 [Gordonia sp. TBRC 11910]|uniref:Uncharacterized protein n=1 Tax=Gordonia asplenii TaxID=2725283 RepID=A0A848KX39_9ACTN|nr:hypothetical protein [Gordonia asplenii]NMO02647.1 hypothetical protein [Gordonia asplenii]